MSGPLEEKFEIFRTCPAVAKRQSLFKMQPAYKVGRKNSLKHPRRTEYDIMYEIMTHGPVQGMPQCGKMLRWSNMPIFWLVYNKTFISYIY